MPTSIFSAKAIVSCSFSPTTYPARPKFVALALARASSSSAKVWMVMTGPKISWLAISKSWVTPDRTVGAYQKPLVSSSPVVFSSGCSARDSSVNLKPPISTFAPCSAAFSTISATLSRCSALTIGPAVASLSVPAPSTNSPIRLVTAAVNSSARDS